MSTYYAAYDDNAVYATGTSPEAAIRNAHAEVGNDDGDFETARISQELKLRIDENGWDGAVESFEIKDGELVRSTQTFRDHRGDEHDYDAAVMLMDDDLREELHGEITPCTDQEFMAAYAERHLQKFGEGFAPYVGGEW